MTQTASQILMVRPVAFGFNEQTAVNNAFQQREERDNINAAAQKEFDDFTALLLKNGINIYIVNDTIVSATPDSIFPNNWFSTHVDDELILYPLFAPNRRAERGKNALVFLHEAFSIRREIDLTHYENENQFLEGTGSMVLDRLYHKVYACLSPRTDATVLYDFCEEMDYTPILFHAQDAKGMAIYHTNVMMCIADEYAIIVAAAIVNQTQRELVINSLEESGKAIISITLEQMQHFAGNALQVSNTAGDRFLVMSSQAYNAFTQDQINLLNSYHPILHAPLDTIEKNGGGSARCMMAEIFLQQKNL